MVVNIPLALTCLPTFRLNMKPSSAGQSRIQSYLGRNPRKQLNPKPPNRRPVMDSSRVPQSRIVEAASRGDLLSRFQLCFQILEPGSKLNMNWHLEAMAYYLELVLHGLIKRLIICA